MKRKMLIAAIVAAGLAAPAAADDETSPEQVIAKVREAAAYLQDEGEAGLAAFDSGASRFVWADTYVFVWDCGADVVAAHPVAESRGLSISGLKDATGKAFGEPMCAAAGRPGGGWVEYMWPRPVMDGGDDLTYSDDPARKITYMLAVPGQPYQVGAGEYDDTLTVEELDALLK